MRVRVCESGGVEAWQVARDCDVRLHLVLDKN